LPGGSRGLGDVYKRQQIIKEAKAGKFDMIIMGTKGRSSWADTVIGSVAQRVIGSSKTPVVLVKD
jgi:nucleotide-binding universal stress UspA family protein